VTIGTEKMQRSCFPFAAMDGCRRKTVLPSAVFFSMRDGIFQKYQQKGTPFAKRYRTTPGNWLKYKYTKGFQVKRR